MACSPFNAPYPTDCQELALGGVGFEVAVTGAMERRTHEPPADSQRDPFRPAERRAEIGAARRKAHAERHPPVRCLINDFKQIHTPACSQTRAVEVRPA